MLISQEKDKRQKKKRKKKKNILETDDVCFSFVSSIEHDIVGKHHWYVNNKKKQRK